MESTELITALGEKLGIELLPDEDGACGFEADGLAVSVNALPELDAIALSGDLGEPPPVGLETLSKAMLEAQYLFRGTHGATISLDAGTGRFALCRSIPCKALDAESFFVETEQFVNTLEFWFKVINDYRGTVDAIPGVPARDGGPADKAFVNAGFMSV